MNIAKMLGIHLLPEALPACSVTASPAPRPDRGVRREVLRLAVPAFLALIAEPLFLLVDSAVVGRLPWGIAVKP